MKVAMLLLEVAAVEEGGEGKEKSKEGWDECIEGKQIEPALVTEEEVEGEGAECSWKEEEK